MSRDKEQPATRLTRTAEGLQYHGDTLHYRITGLTAYNLDRMYVTLKAYKPDDPITFHADKLDLYYARSRESYAGACEKYLKTAAATVITELCSLIRELEAERINMREKGSSGEAVPKMTDEERKEALAVLKSKDLLKSIIGDFDAIGFIGEKHNKLLAYIAGISRLLADPLAILILSRPGAGKTSLQDAVCKLIPPESVIKYTRLTGQSLFYREKNALTNKVMAIEEEEGMQSAMYSVKTLISSQKLSVATTRTDPKSGKLSVDEYTVEGPVVVFVSTTQPDSLDDETKRRFLILTIDESDEQTKTIMQAQRTRNSDHWYKMTCDESSITRLHHNMQRLLKPLTVTIPGELNMNFPYERLQYRGEQGKFLSLVKAVTLLHQHQRKTGTIKRVDGTKLEYVQATQKDIDLALSLGREVFYRNIDDLSPSSRRLLGQIVKLVDQKYKDMKTLDPKKELLYSDIPFTRKELREFTAWSETQVRVNIIPLCEQGYLGVLRGRYGSTFRYVLLDDGSADPRLEL